MKFPMVTYSLKEFYEKSHCASKYRKQDKTVNGLYLNGYIWLKQPSFSVLAHELTHHFFRSLCISNSTTRFFRFVNKGYEYLWYMIKYHKQNKGIIWAVLHNLGIILID